MKGVFPILGSFLRPQVAVELHAEAPRTVSIHYTVSSTIFSPKHALGYMVKARPTYICLQLPDVPEFFPGLIP